MNNWRVYLLTCSDGSLYCGITTDVAARLETHNAGRGAKYTRGRRPVRLAAASGPLTRSDALKFERTIKKLPAVRKITVLEAGYEPR